MKIAYIMSRFPLLSETFILREMDEVENQGGEIVLYPLICQEQEVIHLAAKKWMSRRNCIPLFSFSTVGKSLGIVIRRPFKVLQVLGEVIHGNLSSPKFMIRALSLFPKSLVTASLISKDGADHIHAHYASHPALMAYIISRLTGISYSITIHSHDVYDNHSMLKQKLGRAKFLVTISDYNVEYLCALLGEQIREKIHVVRCGVNPKDYKPLPPRIKSGKKKLEIIQIGSLHWKKDQINFLKSIQMIREDFPNIHVSIIGDGPERKKIQAAIEELDLQKTVTLMGARSQDEVRKILPTADIYIQSSVSEGIPVALMEALSCELPVIATSITGIPELIRHEETGLLVPPRDPKAIASAIKKLILEPEKGGELGKNGRKLVGEEFNLTKNVSSLIQIFQSFIHN